MAVYNYIISFGIPGDANSGVTFENINKKGGFYQMKKKLLSALLVAAMAVSTLAVVEAAPQKHLQLTQQQKLQTQKQLQTQQMMLQKQQTPK